MTDLTQALLPSDLRAPFGNYAHGMLLHCPQRIVFTSGQLGISKDGAIAPDITAQTQMCFHNIERILAAADMTAANIVHLRAFVTQREFFAPYMRVRDDFLHNRQVASTLLIVNGFTLPEFLVEIEATAVSL